MNSDLLASFPDLSPACVISFRVTLLRTEDAWIEVPKVNSGAVKNDSATWAMAVQYAFFICTGFLIVGGLVFLLGACFVVADKQKVDDFYEGEANLIFSIS